MFCWALSSRILLDCMIQKGLFERSVSHPEVITRFSGVSNKSPFKLNGKLVNYSTRSSPPEVKDALTMAGVVRLLKRLSQVKGSLILHDRNHTAGFEDLTLSGPGRRCLRHSLRSRPQTHGRNHPFLQGFAKDLSHIL